MNNSDMHLLLYIVGALLYFAWRANSMTDADRKEMNKRYDAMLSTDLPPVIAAAIMALCFVSCVSLLFLFWPIGMARRIVKFMKGEK